MYTGRDTHGLKGVYKSIPLAYPKGVLGPSAGIPWGHRGGGYPFNGLEKVVVLLGKGLATLDFLGEMLEFYAQNGGLDGVETAIDAHSLVMVALLATMVEK